MTERNRVFKDTNQSRHVLPYSSKARKQKAPKRYRRLWAEALETRSLLAGDIISSLPEPFNTLSSAPGLQVLTAGTLTELSPAGSLSYSQTLTGTLTTTATIDTHSLTLDAGQTISVVITPNSLLNIRIRVLDAANTELANVTSGTAGKAAVVQPTYIVIHSWNLSGRTFLLLGIGNLCWGIIA